MVIHHKKLLNIKVGDWKMHMAPEIHKLDNDARNSKFSSKKTRSTKIFSPKVKI